MLSKDAGKGTKKLKKVRVVNNNGKVENEFHKRDSIKRETSLHDKKNFK